MTDERNEIDVLAEEFLARVRKGEHVTPEQYAAAHPELADEIREVLPALLLLEQARPSSDATADFTDSLSAPPPQRLGEYRVLRQIGRGGMGIVYEAVQESLGRHVALKVLPTPPPGQEGAIERFRREARAAARLHHTNIVPVFGVGCDGGVNYYVMQYIHGQPLDDVLEEVRRMRGGAVKSDRPASEIARHLVTNRFASGEPCCELGEPRGVSTGCTESNKTPRADATGLAKNVSADSSSFARQPEARFFRACAKLAYQSAEALAYAHAQGIQHRDIKPSNILLDVQGTAWITDFGLAKLDEDAALTRTGDIVGTLRYMAPERFRGEGDARSDVYALGITLYEMLTLQPAFAAKDRLELIEQVTQTTPPTPRSVDRRLPRDLDTIVQKATARNPKERYATAAALADDLGRYLNDQPIRARRQSVIERTWKWAKRRPAAAALVATVLLATAALIAGGVYFNAAVQFERGRLAKKDTELTDALGKVRETEEQATGNLARSDFLIAAGHHQRGKPLETLVALNRVPERLRQWEWRFLQRQALGSDVTMWGHAGPVWSVAFSPDGQRLASGSDDHTVKLWDGKTGAVVSTLNGHTDRVSSVTFSPDGLRLVSGSHDCTIKLWDARTGALISTLDGHTGGVSSISFSPDGQRLASGSTDNTVRLWDVRTGAVVHTLTGHTAGVWSVAFSPDGARLASGSHDGTIKFWDARTGAVVHTVAGNTIYVLSVAFSPDGSLLASGNYDCTIKLWDVRTGAVVQTLSGHTGAVWSVAFSPDGARLASGSDDSTIKLWDTRTGTVGHTFTGHTNPVSGIAFSPDGQRLASGSIDRTLKLWDARTGAIVQTLTGHTNEVLSFAFSPDAGRLATGSVDKTIKLWDARTSEVVHTLTGHTNAVTSVVFSPDGARLASGGYDNLVKLWDACTGTVVHTLTGHTSPVTSVAFSVDGARIASGSHDNKVKVWDARTGAEVLTLMGHTGLVLCVAFSPDGVSLASCSVDNTVKLWNARTGTVMHTLTGHTKRVLSVAFSPDGSWLASGSDDNTVKLWDAHTGAVVHTLTGHTNTVTSVAYSPDGARLASGSADLTIKLWDARTRGLLHTLTGHDGWVSSVAFSPDGVRLASGSYDDTVKLWNTGAGAAMHTLTGHTSKVLSFAFSPDGTRLASGGNDSTIKLWDARTGVLLHTLTGHACGISSVSFSPDGLRLTSRAQDENIKVWDVNTAKEVPDSNGKDWLGNQVGDSRSPDGQRFAIGHEDGTILLVEPVAPDAAEIGYREGKARFDSQWAEATARENTLTGCWFGALFQFDRLIANGAGPGPLRFDRVWALYELGRWSEAVGELQQAVAKDVKPDEDWSVAVRRLAIGDRAGFDASLAQLKAKHLAGQSPATATVGLLMCGSPFESLAINRTIREWESEVRQTVHLACLDGIAQNLGGLDVWCISPMTRAILDVRKGKAVDVLKLSTNRHATHFLWQALSDLNRQDRDAARRRLDEAEAWLSAPTVFTPQFTPTRLPNAVAIGFDDRLRIELLRREVRTKLGLDPNEPVKYDGK